MTDHIVETSDGGFTLTGLVESSRNVFGVSGGPGALYYYNDITPLAKGSYQFLAWDDEPEYEDEPLLSGDRQTIVIPHAGWWMFIFMAHFHEGTYPHDMSVMGVFRLANMNYNEVCVAPSGFTATSLTVADTAAYDQGASVTPYIRHDADSALSLAGSSLQAVWLGERGALS
jgi:hypothetical protein